MSNNFHPLIQAAAARPLSPQEKKERLATLMHYKEQLYDLKAADAPLDLIIITLFDLAELYARLGNTYEAKRYYRDVIQYLRQQEQEYLTFLNKHLKDDAVRDELYRIRTTIQSLLEGTYYNEQPNNTLLLGDILSHK